ncbi:MAG: hypothetical protein ACTSO3_06100 [Candidatus Heimdallarchaeaceae archaeon]
MEKKILNVRRTTLLISLCLSLLIYVPISTHAIDVSDSEILLPADDTLALQRISITVWVKGTSGDVNGASVNISCPSGYFSATADVWATSTTDSNGLVSFDWYAPDTPTEISPINVTFSADINSGTDDFVVEKNVTVHPIDFSTSFMYANPTELYELHSASVTIYANTSIFPNRIEGVTVDLICDEGIFLDTGTATTSVITNYWGWVTVTWQANLSIIISSPLTVNLTADLSYTGKIVSTSLNEEIIVNPMDINSSTLEVSDTTVGGGYPVTVTARAVGDYGSVSHTEVLLDALDGEFTNGETNITALTDSNGYFVTTWTSPEVGTDLEIVITSIFRFPTTTLFKELNVTIEVQAFSHNFTNILTYSNATTATVGDYVLLSMETFNEIGQLVADANVTFTAPAGVFIGSGTDTIELITDATGSVSVVWDTSNIIVPIGGFDYHIDLSLIKEYYNTNSSVIIVHVNPDILTLETDSSATPLSIVEGANVTITVHVTANGFDIEGATVQILAQAGVFEFSSTETAAKNTDASGIVTFIWITSSLTVTVERDFEFSIQASLPGYTDSDVEYISITVEPDETHSTGPTDGDGLTTGEKIGILLGAVGGVLLIGTIAYMVLKKKAVN